jgi:hypothetical protein
VNGSAGSSGTSGTGFNTVQSYGSNRVLVSDGTPNGAIGSTGFTYNGSTVSLHDNSLVSASYLDFSTSLANPSISTGRLFYDAAKESLAYYPLSGINVEILVGRQLYSRAINNSGSTIAKGSAVKIQSALGAIPVITKAIATNTGNNQVVGLVADDILSGSEGFIINAGKLSDLNLSSYSIGDILYLSDVTPGDYVAGTSSLDFSSRSNQIGYVIDNGATSGVIYVSINNEDINLSLTDIERVMLYQPVPMILVRD